MKKYHLTYEFLGETREFKTEHLFEFMQKLEEIEATPEISNRTINFYTEEQ